MSNAFIVRPLPFSGVTAEGSAAGTSLAYLGNDFIGVVHRGTGTTTGQIVASFAAAQSIDCAALLSCAFGSAATWAYTAGGVSAQLVYPSGNVLPVSGRGHGLIEFTGLSASSVQLDFASLGGAPVEAGRLVIGKKIQLARNFAFGGSRGVQDTGGLDWSIAGVPLRRYGKRLRTVRISFENAYKDEVEAAILPLLEYVGTTDPILLCLDSGADAQRMNRLYFGFLKGTQEVVQRNSRGFRWGCEMVSLI